MNDSLLMLQLVFNLMMLVAIILLSRSPAFSPVRAGSSRAERRASRRSARAGRRATRAARRAERASLREAPGPHSKSVAPPPHLDALLAETDSSELVAEAALRQRLARLGGASEARG